MVFYYLDCRHTLRENIIGVIPGDDHRLDNPFRICIDGPDKVPVIANPAQPVVVLEIENKTYPDHNAPERYQRTYSSIPSLMDICGFHPNAVAFLISAIYPGGSPGF